jgi:hypothetical protein
MINSNCESGTQSIRASNPGAGKPGTEGNTHRLLWHHCRKRFVPCSIACAQSNERRFTANAYLFYFSDEVQ